MDGGIEQIEWSRTASPCSGNPMYWYPRVHVPTGHHTVGGRFAAPHPTSWGYPMCMSQGMADAEQCQGLDWANGNLNFAAWGQTRTYRVWCMAAVGIGGDSGGPVYSFQNRVGPKIHAAGTIVGFIDLNGDGTHDSTCFSHIYYVLNRTNTQLATG